MTCKEAEKMIPLFLEDDLDMDDLQNLMEHIEQCEECKEELTIQLLVSEGMARLETGSVFDLQKELKLKLGSAEHTLRSYEYMKKLLFVLEGLTAVLVITVIEMLIFH